MWRSSRLAPVPQSCCLIPPYLAVQPGLDEAGGRAAAAGGSAAAGLKKKTKMKKVKGEKVQEEVMN
jgi:hypothetical protein